MRFAIIGAHPDGLAVARLLPELGHELCACLGCDAEIVREGKAFSDLEELLSDPQIEAVIVASPVQDRLNHLRRVLQSERSALVVHPVDDAPDGGYEVNMLQGDVHRIALPIFFDAYREQLTQQTAEGSWLDLQYSTREPGLWPAETRPAFPGWTALRRLGGEILEVSAYANHEELEPGDIVFVQGRFASGKLFRASFAPSQAADRMQVADGSIAIDLRAPDRAAVAAVIHRFEEAMQRLAATPKAPPGAGSAVNLRDGLSWLDEIRALELNDAVRQSAKRRRATALDFQEANEEVGFKGTMTLLGCTLIWLLPLMLVVAAMVPQLFWILVLVVFGFLMLQLLRWIVPPGNSQGQPPA